MNNHCKYKNAFRILKGGKISLVVSAIVASATITYASPSGGVVTSGSATISQSGSVTNINQSTNKASINWNKFNIASNETVNFNQPNSSSITLNRVIGNETSVINGALNANGQVWILNSNGVLFGKNASINTSGLLATTKNLSDENFQAGNYSFIGDSTGSVINTGTINIKNSGYVVFASNEVQNSGTIKAISGEVHLVGADEYTINLNGNSLVNLTVDKGVLDALVENSGTIIADGGSIYLTTNAVDELLRGVVNNTGVLEANSLDDVTGTVEVYAHGGATNISGTIEAKDGFVETSGKDLNITDSAKVTAKTWLLDPTNIIIQSESTDTINSTTDDATISATAIQNSLSTTNVKLQADEDITVNEDITWSESTKLTLTASDEIYVNATIENTNDTYGGVYFQAANTTDKVIFGTNGKVIINNMYQLQWVNTALNGKYELGSDIDASDTSTWNSDGEDGYYGFDPIGDETTNFTGTFDGNGYTISDLYINRSGTDYVGLFGYTYGSTILNIGLIDIDITGASGIGGLVGYNSGTISNSYAIGSVSGTSILGGLVGYNSGTISNSYATGSVSGTSDVVGGLIGQNYYGTIENSYATGSVSGTSYVGGLVGLNDYKYSTIENSYATGSVTGTGENIGGLVGYNDGTITNSFWDIDTTGQNSGLGSGTSSGVTGIHSSTETINAFNEDTYSGFDFDDTWYIIDGETRPFLQMEYSTNITNDHQLQLMVMDLAADYTLSNNITYTGDMWSSSTGFSPIGNYTKKFTGTFDGNGYTISDLYINRSTYYYVGLFGYTSGSTILNIGLIDIDITGASGIGGLVGYNGGTISSSYSTGSISGRDAIGSLVGENSGTITNSYATGSVSGTSDVGGLVGINDAGTIKNSYATGSVSGTSAVGGLVGWNYRGTITNSFYDKETSGLSSGVGDDASTITSVTGLTTAQMSYGQIYKDAGWDIVADSSVTSTTPVLKYNSTTDTYYWAIAPITLSYTLGTASSTYDGTSQSLSDFYTTSSIFGTDYITGSTDYLDGDYTFQVLGSEVSGYKDAGTYSNIKVASNSNFLTIASSGNTDGTLIINKADATVTANSDTVTYNGTVQGASGFTATGLVNGETISVLDGVSVSGSGTNAGTYTTKASGTDENYNLTFVDGVLTVNSLPTSNNQNLVNKIIVPIQNQAAVINQTVINNNITNPIKPITQFEIPQSNGSNVTAVQINENTRMVTLSQLKEDNQGNSVRVPLNNSSSVILIDSGVNLPQGIDQEFYVAAEQE